MREKEVKLLKVCMGADDRELARYAKAKLKDKGFLIEENVVSKGRRLSDHDLSRLRRIPPSLSVSAGGGMNLLQYDLFL